MPVTRHAGRAVLLVATAVSMLLAAVGGALAHEERESVFPDQDAPVPQYRPFDEAIPHLVVCKDDSAARIAEIADPELRALNEHLLGECEFEHIQSAVDAVTQQGTNIYVLPGEYLEEPTRPEPACGEQYGEGAVPYEAQVECGSYVNLITVAGDDPSDDDAVCDNALCNLQIEGTGTAAEDVVVRGGFRDDANWVKHNGIRADRADGFYLKDVTFELFRENAMYVHETDGYVLDGVVGRMNDLYAILTFAADHGVIKNCETYFNGDSGIYPGSAADVNADSTETGPLDRWAVEIHDCDTHHNALGFSGTAGNSVYFHDNLVHDNGAGYVTDSFVPNHPGMPQDHAWLENNRIYRNNTNYYEQYVHSGVCDADPADRGYEDGTVCPAFPVPVGTGVMIAGGNHNLVNDNLIYDNWRQGAMLFWVPAALRFDPRNPDTINEANPLEQYETSNHNHFTNNTMGQHPDGLVQPNGVDFWWDDEGEGNCWQGNTSTATEDGTATSNTPHFSATPTSLPDCDSGGSVFTPSDPVKSAGLVPCATYDREDNPDPDGCDWFDSPEEPEGRQTAAGAPEGSGGDPGGDDTGDVAGAPAAADGSGSGLPATGGGAVVALLGAGLAWTAGRLRRRRRG